MANLVQRPVELFTTNNTRPEDRISPNFIARDLIRSDIATRQNIDNWFKDDTCLRSAVRLCREVLQPVRDRFWPFNPNSVYRSQVLERALKKKPVTWKSASQHTKGEAADIEVPGLSNIELAEWIRDHLKFDQLILEMYDPVLGPNSGWVHVSLAATNRREMLRYTKRDGKYIYLPGLI